MPFDDLIPRPQVLYRNLSAGMLGEPGICEEYVMKVTASDVLLSSERTFMKTVDVKESLRAWIGDRRPNFESTGRTLGSASSPAVVSLSADAVKKQKLADQAQAGTPAVIKSPIIPSFQRDRL